MCVEVVCCSGIRDWECGLMFLGGFWFVIEELKVSGSQGLWFSGFMFHGSFVVHECLEQHAKQVPTCEAKFHGSPTTVQNAQVAPLSLLKGQGLGAQLEGVGFFGEGMVWDGK
jgi:hypothetical protein